MALAEYQALGGHMAHVRSLADVLRSGAWHNDGAPTARRFEGLLPGNVWPLGQPPLLG